MRGDRRRRCAPSTRRSSTPASLVQLDDARAAVTYDRMVPPSSLEDYRSWVARQVEIINHAHRGHPARERIRYHVCWGSWPGPHTTDVPLKDIVDLVLQGARRRILDRGRQSAPRARMAVWENVKLPKETVLIPGVISHATNIVEHPELVAERIVRLARLVGRENVIAEHRLRLRAGDVLFAASIRRSCGRSSRRWSRARGSRRGSSGAGTEEER